MKRKPVALFSDEEAVFYPDVARVLEATDRRFEYIRKSSLTSGELNSFSVLVIPGGYTFKLLENLDERSKRSILRFVENGGGYVGICMGTYVASELGLTKSSTIRVAGEYDVELSIVQPRHPVMKGYEGRIKMSYQNGPEIIVKGADVSLAAFPNGRAAIVAGSFGYGRMVLFSPHPERSRSSWGMVTNALDYSHGQAGFDQDC